MHSRASLMLASILVLSLAGCTGGEAEVGPPPPPEVKTSRVSVETFHDWADFTGRLEAVETVDVRPRVAGFVDTVHFSEGRFVEQGALLFRIDPRPFEAQVDRLVAEQAQAAATLELARSNRDRAERLLAQNATSEEEWERFAADAAVAEAELAAVSAALEAAKLDLSFTRVTAPISGRVSRAIVTPGNLVDSSTVLTTLVSDGRLYAYFDMDEQTYLDHVGAIGHAKQARVYVGLINEQGYPHAARLDFVDNQVDADHGTIRARALLDNPDGRFTPGLFARLRLVSTERYTGALIDDRAVGTDLGRKYVLVVDDSNVVQYRAVETGRIVDGMRVVTAGLDSGDEIVVAGLQRVRPGAVVAPTKVAMQRPRSSADRILIAGHTDSSDVQAQR